MVDGISWRESGIAQHVVRRIMMSETTKKCAHELCKCLVTDKKYCSQFCEDSKNVTALECDCKHPACEAAKI
jgi:hypothetical protein